MAASLQRSLFPDGFELEADALDALESLEVTRGLALLEGARRTTPELENLADIESALDWMRRELGSEPAGAERGARLFLELPHAGLPAGAALFADRALARFGLRRARGFFMDAEQRVPIAALRLVLGHAEEAWRELAGLVAKHPERADLLGWLGDGYTAVGRADQAMECTTRALLLDANAVDLFRLREPRLRRLWAELRAVHAEDHARQLLFVHAWLRGLLLVPRNNEWLNRREAGRLLQSTGDDPASRARRFAVLLYLDRSRPIGTCDLVAREEMSSLAPELFQRFVAVLREQRS